MGKICNSILQGKRGGLGPVELQVYSKDSSLRTGGGMKKDYHLCFFWLGDVFQSRVWGEIEGPFHSRLNNFLDREIGMGAGVS